jgi:hypothetical protein
MKISKFCGLILFLAPYTYTLETVKGIHREFEMRTYEDRFSIKLLICHTMKYDYLS